MPSPSSSASSTSLNPSLSPPNMSQCAICGDKATGRHYGCVNSCDGCKGFFRRSIRKEHIYKCRFKNDCNVDKTHRNACRACRLRKCFVAGMRIEAIQNERDSIGKRRKLDPELNEGANFLKDLTNAESLCIQLRESVIKSTDQISYDKGKIKYEGNTKMATLNDVGSSIHQQLLLTVEWAKSLGPFRELELDDQAALLKANATSLIVLAVAIRSMALDDGICLANDTYLPIENAALVGDINAVVVRIVRELVRPARELGVELSEYIALKAVLFFNPYNAVSVSPECVRKLQESRLISLKALKQSVREGADNECRMGELLLLLPAVQAVAQQLAEDVQLCRLFQLTSVDSLMEALILQEYKEDSVDKRILVERLTSMNPG
ncbi:unnamed protein product [Bursaphelenchus xylophilus]|uniref:(pine wood nematode) hypothetical protein n=1 Tax=Bursaphelenchus xylophilus TaxID=6326 RepID=A0A1I7SC26_BURXY|nr:unnamed protein product [Bursaphelenchus xylophilus]CAG9086441.1 unnamed protein product [Bursaphelenchus xylophilus]